jgi:hypothetical protein
MVGVMIGTASCAFAAVAAKATTAMSRARTIQTSVLNIHLPNRETHETTLSKSPPLLYGPGKKAIDYRPAAG